MRLRNQYNHPPPPSVTSVLSRPFQRKCASGQHTMAGGECDECNKTRLQRRAANEAHPVEVPPSVNEILSFNGQPLDAGTRGFMESRFGHDFSKVRVHIDARAAESARAVNASAYTIGADVIFGASQYKPGTTTGNKLLAHELTHVVQQNRFSAFQGQLTIGPAGDRFEQEADHVSDKVARGEDAAVENSMTVSSANLMQRDLSTPPPAAPEPAQPNLTPQQIQQAIDFNRERYDRTNTRLIQNILGGDVTGEWNEGNIEAIAATQEQYGLKKDGMVGSETFRFLNEEARLEPMSTATANCLTSFLVDGPDPYTFRPVGPNLCDVRGHFRTQSQFSSRCNCSEFQYRQFIRGHFRRERGGVVTDMSREFDHLPAGQLLPAFHEDGDTGVPAFYGHRNQPARRENRYVNDRFGNDQTNGCRYRSEDEPGMHPIRDCRQGDVYDMDINFRGEIQRNGVPIETKFWTAIRDRFTVP